MLIDEDSDENEAAVEQGDDVAGAAYRESLTSVDGFTRGAGGRVKFHKDTKKRRRENDDGSDVEMADATGASAGEKRKAKKRSPVKLGREFKAKVRVSLLRYALLLNLLHRTPEGTSSVGVMIHTRTFPFLKQPKKAPKGATVSP